MFVKIASTSKLIMNVIYVVSIKIKYPEKGSVIIGKNHQPAE